jgi:(p)ppGpp synthase/HD superfamily hydrolase
MKEWIIVLKAADAAARWHVHQRRKGAAKEPYINHLLEVASLVAEATGGKDPISSSPHCFMMPSRTARFRNS